MDVPFAAEQSYKKQREFCKNYNYADRNDEIIKVTKITTAKRAEYCNLDNCGL